jgi:hypothetical protein
MPGDSVYKDHTFNKEGAHTSHENSTIRRTTFHNTIREHEYYKTQETENTKKKKTENTNTLSGNEPGSSSL